jgi:hypothetical protein
MNGTRDLGTLGGLRDKFCGPLTPLWGTHSRGSRDVSGALVFKGLALPPPASCIGDGRKTMVKYLSCLPSIMDCSEDLKKRVLDDLKKIGFIGCGDNATMAERGFFSLQQQISPDADVQFWASTAPTWVMAILV